MVETTRYGSSLVKQWRNRQATGPLWRSSGVNVSVRVRLGETVKKTLSYGSALAKQSRNQQARVRLVGQAVVKTLGNGSALAKQWHNPQSAGPPGQTVRRTPFTSLPWPSRDKNSRMPLRLGKVVVKRQDAGPRWPTSEENLRIRVHLGKAVKTTPGYRSADGGVRKGQES
ncbi:hypothetical protein Y032_0102g3504 [Ancylostoma ceylanicum]|uniref:Uncharacterized protein n=1 Tax=Ancylostoma ceylanicum TaxID=53326 RepID=A0A016THH3_9BILA|nr:hypothetical protein Y032_0102g3504 [Ancylostoma ceylanicum]